MAPFGIKGKMPGIARRPRFLMHRYTEELVARNALAYEPSYTGKRIALPVRYDHFHMPKPIWTDKNIVALDFVLKQRTRPSENICPLQVSSMCRRRLRGKTCVIKPTKFRRTRLRLIRKQKPLYKIYKG